MATRQIVHIDMDAFYASVEQRDDASLRGKPVVVAWRGSRSVVCAASYEARKFGIRSAMPAITAERLCPFATFVPPDFTRYRAVSRACREIFSRYTERIEPFSLDEAYLDVSGQNGLEVAGEIRANIRNELDLTASAGIAPNKFLSKIASDWRKPDGIFEIRPGDIDGFLTDLPVGKLPGVGKVTEERLETMGIKAVGQIRSYGLLEMEALFGRAGRRLFQLSCGKDESEVVSDRPTQSISAEDTFASDVILKETAPTLVRLAERVWELARAEARPARTVVLKLKTSDFKILTRSFTPGNPISSEEELVDIAVSLLDRVELGPGTTYRLVGVGLSNFFDLMGDASQPTLFDFRSVVEVELSAVNSRLRPMDPIRQHLVKSLKGGSATDTFEQIVSEVPTDKRYVVPEGGERSAWQIVDHMRFTLEDLFEFTENEDGTYKEKPWPDGYWPKGPAPEGDEGWDKSINEFHAARARMIELVEDEGRDLTKTFPWGEGQSLMHEALLAIDHTAYHLGQLVELTRWLKKP